MARKTEASAPRKVHGEWLSKCNETKDEIKGEVELGAKGLKEPDSAKFEHLPTARAEPHKLTSSVQPPIDDDRGSRLSKRNPLPALAVYVDVNIYLALELLRTAARAVVQEAAVAFRGIEHRCKLARRLHGRLQNFWLFSRQQVLARTSNGASSFQLSRLLTQRQQSALVLGEGTEASLSDVSTCNSLSRDDSTILLTAYESFTQVDWEADRFHGLEIKQRAAPASCWLPLRRHDGRVIAPPVELLASYADNRSRTTCPNVASGEMPACVVGLCVRSLLDLYIQAIRSLQPALLPEGSVVLMAAVNIPMMFRVLKEHNLVVHPLDLDTDTLMPTEDSLRQAIVCWGHRIKALLCSHLYGGICDIQPLVAFCSQHKLLLIEDCAESFVGELYRGHPQADVTFFSFGLIKTCTAGGGGIATVRRRLVAARMQSIQALYPYSGRWASFKKLCVAAGACVVQSTFFMRTFLRLCKCADSLLEVNFSSYCVFSRMLRFLPCFCKARTRRRLELWNMAEFLEQQSRAGDFARRLQRLGFLIPGFKADIKTFWLFPVIAPSRISATQFAAALRENGLWASRDVTTLVCCSPSLTLAGDRERPLVADDMMSRIVYLPVNRWLANKQLQQVEAAVAKTVQGLLSQTLLGSSKVNS